MDLNKINVELRRLTELTADWQLRGGADELEREVALGMLRRVYEAIRFSEIAPVRSAETEHPIEVPAMLDLDGILAPDVSGVPVVSGAADAMESDVPVPSAADPSPAEGRAADPEPVPGVAVESEIEQDVAVESEISARESVDSQAAVSAAESPEPAISDPEPIAADDAVQVAPERPVPSSDASSSGRSPVVEPALFGLDEIVQHKRKQRVIMSLYDDSPDTLRQTSRLKRTETVAEKPDAELRMPEIPVERLTEALAVPAGAPASEEMRAAVADEPVGGVSAEAIEPAVSAESGAVLGEVINRNVQTLAETLAPRRDAVADVAHRAPVSDLRAAIGINDKFLLIRDLFDGDAEACDRAIEALNAFDELDDCMIYIAEHYAWNPNSDGAKLLMDLLERKLA